MLEKLGRGMRKGTDGFKTVTICRLPAHSIIRNPLEN